MTHLNDERKNPVRPYHQRAYSSQHQTKSTHNAICANSTYLTYSYTIHHGNLRTVSASLSLSFTSFPGELLTKRSEYKASILLKLTQTRSIQTDKQKHNTQVFGRVNVWLCFFKTFRLKDWPTNQIKFIKKTKTNKKRRNRKWT